MRDKVILANYENGALLNKKSLILLPAKCIPNLAKPEMMLLESGVVNLNWGFLNLFDVNF